MDEPVTPPESDGWLGGGIVEVGLWPVAEGAPLDAEVMPPMP